MQQSRVESHVKNIQEVMRHRWPQSELKPLVKQGRMSQPLPDVQASRNPVGTAKSTVAILDEYDNQFKPTLDTLRNVRDALHPVTFFESGGVPTPISDGLTTSRSGDQHSDYNQSRDPRKRDPRL